MPKPLITKPEAVKAALSEFDQLGETAFLDKYGFGKSRHVIEWNGKRYPGKAILAAAHGVQFPQDAPLELEDLKGASARYRKTFEQLGFTVIDTLSEILAEQLDGPKVWLEKSYVDRPDRQEGSDRLGYALWSPQFDSGGGDSYRAMRDLSPGDWVLHLTDGKAIVGRSQVAASATDFPDPPPGTPWSSQACQRVQLKNYEELQPSLPTKAFLRTEPYSAELLVLKDLELQNVFYTRTLELVQGGYLTQVPDVLLGVLTRAYEAIGGSELVPHRGSDVLPKIPTSPMSSSGLEGLCSRTNLTEPQVEDILGTLRSKQQIILYGSPGTGKTFVADAIARHLTGNPINPEEGLYNSQYELVQFHQSYGYEDFIQGIRPTTTSGAGIGYHVQDGILMRLAARATEDPTGTYVLVIDEINRGNLSRIFGELLLLLEYRSKHVHLPYGEPGSTFALPPNLYFIGTMNTADRSLAQVDYALRRRFRFVRLRAIEDGRAPVLERFLAKQDEITPKERHEILRLFVSLNQGVIKTLGEDFEIGHSYFMEAAHSLGTVQGQERLWRTAINPLLDEYFYARKDRKQLLGDLQPTQLRKEPLPQADAVSQADATPSE